LNTNFFTSPSLPQHSQHHKSIPKHMQNRTRLGLKREHEFKKEKNGELIQIIP
jgi:hypothetical protein